MSNLAFAWPYAALCFLLIVPLWFFLSKTTRSFGFLLSPITLVMTRFVNGGRNRNVKSIPWLLFLFWALLVLSLMRPQLVGQPIEITRDGRNIMLVQDLSESMEAADMNLQGQPVDRLTIAKDVLNDFIDKRRGDRIGLVVFGSEPFLHAPLSFDHPTIKQFLADAQIGFAGPKTAIGDAIGLAVKKLIDAKGDRIMILATDGQNNTGALEPMQAATIAQKNHIKIYIVGLGASRMVVNGFFGPTAINPSASLDEAEPELKEIASLTGGKYFRAKDKNALATIYSEIDALEPVLSEPMVLIPRKELFYWPLTVFLIIMLALWLSRLFEIYPNLVYTRQVKR
jgi:Ca-activated chloride channel family protein